MDTLEQQIIKLMQRNRRSAGVFKYTVPSPITFPYQWLWDSCFHAIIYSHFDLSSARDELLSVVQKQFKNGMLPHVIFWDNSYRTKIADVDWGQTGTSSVTQPPMIAYATLQIYKKDPDTSFLANLYPRLKQFYDYLLNERDPDQIGLYGIMHPDESGEDNSPRFDELLGLPLQHGRDDDRFVRYNLLEVWRQDGFDLSKYRSHGFWCYDVPFNAIMLKNLENMVELATFLYLDEDAARYGQAASNLRQSMREKMVEDGVFWSLAADGKTKIRAKTWAIFAPLFANLYSPHEAKQLINTYLANPNEFGLPFVIPTTAKSELGYDTSGYWRGPVWISTNWFIYQGLKQYGLLAEANHIKASSLALLQQSGFREQFDPETGQGHEAENFTWGGLVWDME